MKQKYLNPIWVIYKYTNNLNGQIYIGQSKDFNQRYSSHLYGHKAKKPTYIDKSINFHGIENFNVEIIHFGILTQEDANQWEAYYIGYFQSLAPNGYNLKGSSATIHNLSEEIRIKRGKEAQGKTKKENGFIGVRTNEPRASNFRATVKIDGNGKSKSFTTAIEAAQAYDKMVLHIYGPDAKLNFPENRVSYISEDLLAFFNFFIEPPVKTSKFKFVVLNPKKKWEIFFGNNPNIPPLTLGTYEKEEDAALLADKVAFYFLGYDSDKLNFPDKVCEYQKEELSIFFQAKKRAPRLNAPGIIKKANKWVPFYTLKGKRLYFGSFLTEIEAIESRNKFIKELEENEELTLSKLNPRPNLKNEDGSSFTKEQKKQRKRIWNRIRYLKQMKRIPENFSIDFNSPSDIEKLFNL